MTRPNIRSPPRFRCSAPRTMISEPRRLASSTIAWPTFRVRTMRVITLTPYWLPRRRRLAELVLGALRLLRHRIGQRRVSGTWIG